MASKSPREPKPNDNRAAPAGGVLGLDAFRAAGDSAGLSLDTGLSLDQLSAGLAGMLGSGEDPYAGATANDAGSTAPVLAGTEPDESAEDTCEITPRSIIEAMLFVGSPQNHPLSSRQVASLMRGVRPAEVDVLVRELNAEYASRRCPYAIVAEGAGYRLTLREEFAGVRDRFHGKIRQARLSQAAIEVLAAVAYNAPITAEEIARMRGVPSGPILLQLVRRQLLCVQRGEESPRRLQYLTTPRFLELFSLASLDDLPRSYDLEEASP